MIHVALALTLLPLAVGCSPAQDAATQDAATQDAATQDAGPQDAGPGTSSPSQGDPRIHQIIADALSEGEIPGGVAGIFRQGEAPVIGAFGVRKTGSDVPFGVTDLVHIGSDTKAMTAVLVARLADRRPPDGAPLTGAVLDWGTTVAEALPEVATRIHRDFRGVTLLQLLRHRGGVPANAADWRAFPGKPIGERRRRLIQANLRGAPHRAPGEAYLYSNLGVMIAGTMAAASRSATWEELMRTEVFQPLGMASAGFGAPGTPGEVDQPWGHVPGRGGKLVPVQADNDAALGPAGTVHLTIEDWGRFVLQFTERAGVESDFLSQASRQQLVEAGPTGYACGWSVVERGWADGAALSHAGSNTMWYAVAWVAPARDRAFLVAVNAAPPGASARVDRVIGQLIELDKAIPERTASAEAGR